MQTFIFSDCIYILTNFVLLVGWSFGKKQANPRLPLLFLTCYIKVSDGIFKSMPRPFAFLRSFSTFYYR